MFHCVVFGAEFHLKLNNNQIRDSVHLSLNISLKTLQLSRKVIKTIIVYICHNLFVSLFLAPNSCLFNILAINVFNTMTCDWLLHLL